MDDVRKKSAKRFTPAQCKALLTPVHDEWVRPDTASFDCLWRRGLFRKRITHGQVFYCLTSYGLAVRAYLKDQEHG